MFKGFYVSFNLFQVKHIVLVNAHCLKLPVWGIFERLCFPHGTEWGIMGRSAARWSRTERNIHRLFFQFSLLLSKLKWMPTLSSTDRRKSPGTAEEKEERKYDLFLFYITTGNGRFLSQTFEASWSDDASPAANHEQIMNIKSHSDRQKKYVTFKNQKRNTPL